MPRVYKPQFTRPIPPDAERTTIRRQGKQVPAVRFRVRDGSVVIAPLTKCGTRCRRAAECWYGRVEGKAVKLSSNKLVAERLLLDLIARAENARAGYADPFEAHRKRPLADHLADYRHDLEARGNTPKSVKLAVGRVRRILEGCGFVFLSDLAATSVQAFLARERRTRDLPPIPPGEWFRVAEVAAVLEVRAGCVSPLVRRHGLEASGRGKARRFPRSTLAALRERLVRGAGPQTCNHYIAAIKAFSRWLVVNRRLPDNPLASLERMNVETDIRCNRRALPGAELRTVIATAAASSREFRGLSGRDRAVLYATAAASGFRAQELAALEPESFDLAGPVPAVTLPARVAKNRRAAVQPLPQDLARELTDYLADKPAGRPVWPGSWWDKAADMLRIDLEAAGIPFILEAAAEELRCDFHSLRHSFVGLCEAAGLSVREAMQLARHSDPRLTLARYGRLQVHDLSSAVNRLPSLLDGRTDAPTGQAVRATGTDGAGIDRADRTRDQRSPDDGAAGGGISHPGRTAYRLLTIFSDADSGALTAADAFGPDTPPRVDSLTPVSAEGLRRDEADCGRKTKYARRDLNPQPAVPKTAALSN